MNGWMILWTVLLAGGAIGLVGLLMFVSVGAVRELKESLNELSEAASEQTDSSHQ